VLEQWWSFWAKYLSVIILTGFFTFIGVLGRYLRSLQKNKAKFSFKVLFVEFFITLSLTIFVALICVSQNIDIIMTCVAVGLSGHFGTNGALVLICKYLKIDCSSFLPLKEENEKNDN